MSHSQSPITHVIKAFVFDVFGTVFDWRTNVVAELEQAGKEHGVQSNWNQFAQLWRNAYFRNTRLISEGKLDGPLSVDVMHRQILDELLALSEYSEIGRAWNDETRQSLTMSWHRLRGWEDALEGIKNLKKTSTVVGLSNGNMSLLIDLAKHAEIPWDAIFSTELYNTFKPNPRAYQETMRHLQLAPEHCLMISSHMWDLRGAANAGMITAYVPRPDEDSPKEPVVQTKAHGGEVDYVYRNISELAVDFILARVSSV